MNLFSFLIAENNLKILGWQKSLIKFWVSIKHRNNSEKIRFKAETFECNVSEMFEFSPVCKSIFNHTKNAFSISKKDQK